MPKIDISDVVKEIINGKKIIVGLASSFSVSNAKNQSAQIHGKARTTFEHFLPLMIIISCEYYLVDGYDKTIDVNKQKFIKEYADILSKRWIKDGGDEKTSKSLLKKYPFTKTNKEFFNSRVVIKNDKSKEHLQAFNVETVSKIPKKNILLKLIDTSDTHLRMGISFDKGEVTIFKVIAIEKKKSGN